ncbi:hypothetical protein RB195_025867 [Necator americanus]|uniref:Anillin homology domain-containing protein n=1 Tax=Necator americanus TaxID=51031 RepID=A0ABR1EUU7_NECAM
MYRLSVNPKRYYDHFALSNYSRLITMQHVSCFNIYGPQPSRANVGVSQISVPLAWNSDQHFKSKGETRVYSMFLVLQTKSRVVDSRMVTNVDRTMTDVVFPESFIFESEPDDFCVEITLYAARTDLGLSDGGGSLRTRITRSLGRRFGGQVKSNLSTMEPPNGIRGDSPIGGTHFNMLARAYLVLTDAGDECKIHDLRMSAFADLSGPPLYGHILCRLAVQPYSVLRPLAEGMLSVKPLCGGRILRNVRTRLQAGNLHCFTNTDIHQSPSAEQTLLLVPITSTSRVMNTSHPNTLLLSSETSPEVEGYDFHITAENYKTMQDWKKAIEMQIDDCAIWATQLYYNKPNIYSSQLPTKMAADYPELGQVIAGKYKQGEPYSSTVTLSTIDGQNFISFAKTNQFNEDLYDGLVAPNLKADLIAETWRRGSEVPLSCSSTYHTNDALSIQVGATTEFKYTKDHSKMARSTDSTKPWVCIGDINRMTSQYVRGGGTTCISSSFLWKAFNVIKDENHC